MGSMRFSISVSSTFPKKGNRLIGLYDVTRSGGLFGFGKSMNLENFHKSGKYDNLSVALYIYELVIRLRV